MTVFNIKSLKTAASKLNLSLIISYSLKTETSNQNNVNNLHKATAQSTVSDSTPLSVSSRSERSPL